MGQLIVRIGRASFLLPWGAARGDGNKKRNFAAYCSAAVARLHKKTHEDPGIVMLACVQHWRRQPSRTDVWGAFVI